MLHAWLAGANVRRACDVDSDKAAMLSCGVRSVWRGLVNNGCKDVWDYDDLVMPLVCVCGTDVFLCAGMVTKGRGACCVYTGVGVVPASRSLLQLATDQ